MSNQYVIRIVYIILMRIGFPMMRFTSMHFEKIINNGARIFAGGILFFILSFFKFRSDLKKIIYQP